MAMKLTKTKLAVLLTLFLGVPFVIWLILPLLSFMTLENVSDAKQTTDGYSGKLIYIRVLVYASLIFIMPSMMGLPREKLSAARSATAVLILVIEVVLVQRLWLF